MFINLYIVMGIMAAKHKVVRAAVRTTAEETVIKVASFLAKLN